MPLIVNHSPKGGAGTTFLTAQLAMHLAERGHEVTAVDLTCQDSLKIHFGMLPSQTVAGMALDDGDTMVVHGVELLNGHDLTHEKRFLEMLASEEHGLFDPSRITILDVASGDRALKALLLRHCDLHICPLMPFAASLATLPQVEPGTATCDLEKTGFVLNQIDDTRRLSRHTHNFMRELLGDKLLGTVRRDEAINEAQAMFEPIAKFAPWSVVRIDLDRLTDAVERRLGFTPAETTADDAIAAHG